MNLSLNVLGLEMGRNDDIPSQQQRGKHLGFQTQKGHINPYWGVFHKGVICIQTRNCGGYKLRVMISKLEDLKGKIIKCKYGHPGPVNLINLG